MNKLSIDRSKWLRGEGCSASRLLRPSDGKMCCLGFYGISCNIPPDSLMNREAPSEVEQTWPKQAWWLGGSGTHPSLDCGRLMRINDEWDRSDAEREAEIITIFAKHDIEVEFF